MRRYLSYARYVIRHKWFVFLAARRLGIPMLGLLHDWSKFLPTEFIPYARHFYGADGQPHQIRDKTGYYKPTDTRDLAFDFAWFLHQGRNKHHAAYWTVPAEDGTFRHWPMPERYVREMVADFIGAGRAQGKPDTAGWYRANGHRLPLHPDTRARVEALIGL